MDYIRIYEALKVIKECCAENNFCSECPLSVSDKDGQFECKVGDIEYCDTPRHWKLEKPQYKAFTQKEDTQNANPSN